MMILPQHMNDVRAANSASKKVKCSAASFQSPPSSSMFYETPTTANTSASKSSYYERGRGSRNLAKTVQSSNQSQSNFVLVFEKNSVYIAKIAFESNNPSERKKVIPFIPNPMASGCLISDNIQKQTDGTLRPIQMMYTPNGFKIVGDQVTKEIIHSLRPSPMKSTLIGCLTSDVVELSDSDDDETDKNVKKLAISQVTPCEADNSYRNRRDEEEDRMNMFISDATTPLALKSCGGMDLQNLDILASASVSLADSGASPQEAFEKVSLSRKNSLSSVEMVVEKVSISRKTSVSSAMMQSELENTIEADAYDTEHLRAPTAEQVRKAFEAATGFVEKIDKEPQDVEEEEEEGMAVPQSMMEHAECAAMMIDEQHEAAAAVAADSVLLPLVVDTAEWTVEQRTGPFSSQATTNDSAGNSSSSSDSSSSTDDTTEVEEVVAALSDDSTVETTRLLSHPPQHQQQGNVVELERGMCTNITVQLPKEGDVEVDSEVSQLSPHSTDAAADPEEQQQQEEEEIILLQELPHRHSEERHGVRQAESELEQEQEEEEETQRTCSNIVHDTCTPVIAHKGTPSSALLASNISSAYVTPDEPTHHDHHSSDMLMMRSPDHYMLKSTGAAGGGAGGGGGDVAMNSVYDVAHLPPPFITYRPSEELYNPSDYSDISSNYGVFDPSPVHISARRGALVGECGSGEKLISGTMLRDELSEELSQQTPVRPFLLDDSTPVFLDYFKKDGNSSSVIAAAEAQVELNVATELVTDRKDKSAATATAAAAIAADAKSSNGKAKNSAANKKRSNEAAARKPPLPAPKRQKVAIIEASPVKTLPPRSARAAACQGNKRDAAFGSWPTRYQSAATGSWKI